MSRDRHLMRLFEQAAELGEAERGAFLDQACAGDEGLRAQVVALLGGFNDSDGFLEQGPGCLPPALGSQDEPATTSGVPGEPSASETISDSALPAGTVLAGRYRVMELIGSGGMGDVYRAADPKLDRLVAIKWLGRALQFNGEMRQRFEREVKAVAGLSHPNVVTLYDIVDHAGVPLAVMEHVEGRTLRGHLEEGLTLRDALRIARDIAAGLDAAHARGLMHRDIKPENVMVTPAPETTSIGTAKVLDFGLARQASEPGDQSLTDTHQTPGTPPYMSPEQVIAGEVGCPTDVFSLGTVLFETLTGKNPFRAGSAMETMQRISQRSTPDLASATAAASEGLVTLVTAMLEQQPDRRPSASAVRDRLEAMLLGSGLTQRVGGTTADSSSTANSLGSFTPYAVETLTNLPRRSAELTGRDTELTELSERLTLGRVVTVLGTGGVGKTSLAYEAARQSRGRFTGGVWLCELAPLRRGDGVLEVLAGVLDGNAGAVNTFEEVLTKLDGGPTLVVLDNCEHVIDAAAELADRLSQQLPDLTVLATSREALQTAGESVLRLTGLPEADATELFVKRAAEQGTLQNDSQLEDRVGQIVRQLEGLPLAIELAAPKLGVMSLSELLEALNNQSVTLRTGRGSRGLSGGPSGGGRQSAIDQTIAWSFDLLEPQEQQTLLALSVFSAWFIPDAAVEVSGLGPSAKLHLQRLVEQSVVARKETRGRSRYRLLEPIRQFCRARVDSGQLEAARERHARYYAARALVLGRGASGYDEIECLHAINAEWPDLREAVAWGRQHRRMEYAVDPVIALDRTAMFQLRTEAFQWLMAAEEEFGDQIAGRADVHAMIANGHWLMGDAGAAEVYLDRSCDLKTIPKNAWVGFFFRGTQTRYEEAIAHFRSVQQLAEASGDAVEKRWAASALPVVLLSLIDPNDPRIAEVLTAAEALLAETSWPTGTAILHLAKGNVAKARGDTPEALSQRGRAIDAAAGCGSRWIELIAKVTIPDDADPSLPPRQRLECSVENLRSLLDLNEKASLPIAIRSLVIALAACEEPEAAARSSAVVERLRGMGEDSRLNPDYRPTIEKLKAQLGEKRFAQLRHEGAALAPADLVELGTGVAASLDESL